MSKLLELGQKSKLFTIDNNRIIYNIKNQKNYEFSDNTPEEFSRDEAPASSCTLE